MVDPNPGPFSGTLDFNIYRHKHVPPDLGTPGSDNTHHHVNIWQQQEIDQEGGWLLCHWVVGEGKIKTNFQFHLQALLCLAFLGIILVAYIAIFVWTLSLQAWFIIILVAYICNLLARLCAAIALPRTLWSLPAGPPECPAVNFARLKTIAILRLILPFKNYCV